MRLASHEVRWFFEGELEEAGAVYSWFARRNWLGQTPAEAKFEWPGFESREDVYCVLSQSGDIGLKWRSDEKGVSLDIKGRTAELGAFLFGRNAVGKGERWVKWQYKNTDVPATIVEMFDIKRHGPDVARIKKNRILRKVRLDALGRDEEVRITSFIDRGLNIELTKLRVDDADAYWTLGFEAFPHDDDQHSAFQSNVKRFLDDYTGPALELEASKSYPEWLIKRADTER